MATLENLKRILIEEYPKDSKDTIELLSNTLNPFMQQVLDAFDGNINFDNINREIVKVKVIVDVNGDIITAGGTSTTSKVKLSKNSKVAGLNVIKSVNKTDPTHYPTANPFIAQSVSGNLMSINKIKGLQSSEQYELTIEIIYE